jgi:hypothetical protein
MKKYLLLKKIEIENKKNNSSFSELRDNFSRSRSRSFSPRRKYRSHSIETHYNSRSRSRSFSPRRKI